MLITITLALNMNIMILPASFSLKCGFNWILIISSLFAICKLWEIIVPYKAKSNKYFTYLTCIKIYYFLTLGFKKQMKAKILLKILNPLSLDVDKSFGIEFPYEEILGDTSKLYIYSKNKPEDRIYDLSNHLVVENSVLGAWSFYLLMTSEYYLPLWDHANYINRKFITSKRNLFVQKHKYSGKDNLEPRVHFTKISDSVSESIVSACYWSEWGGLFREYVKLIITDDKVTKYEHLGEECLLHYNCGIVF